MPSDDQMRHPGEEHRYNPGLQAQEPLSQVPQTGWPANQDFGTGLPEKLPNQPRRNWWKALAQFLFITNIIFLVTTLLAYNHIINPPASRTVIATPVTTPAVQQPTPTSPGGAPTSVPTLSSTPVGGSTPSSTPAVQPSALVANGTIQENLLLTCSGCDDPIRVTINTVQIDGSNGRMIWNITLKDVTGNNIGYGINEWDLQADVSQTKVAATFSQNTGDLTNNIPDDIQGIFAFVPSHNVTYTLTVVIYAYVISVNVKFNPIEISF